MKLIIISQINTPEITSLLSDGIKTGTPHLPTISFTKKTITSIVPGIVLPEFSFEQNLYRVNNAFGGYYSDDFIPIKAEPCSINYSIELPCKIGTGKDEMMLNSWYSPTMRKTCEAFLQIKALYPRKNKQKTLVFLGASGFGKEVIAALQLNISEKVSVHVFDNFLYPLCYSHKDNMSFTDDLNFFKFKYLRLNTTIANLNRYANKKTKIMLHKMNIYEMITYIKWNNVIPDYLYIKKFIGLVNDTDIVNILDYLLELNPQIIIILSLYSIGNTRHAIKDIIFKKYKTIFIPKIDTNNVIAHISPKYPANRCYVITNIRYSHNTIWPEPKSNFSEFPNISDVITPDMKVHKFRLKKILNYDINLKINPISKNRNAETIFEYRELKTIFFETYDRWKQDLDLLQSFIKNNYIMSIRLMNMIQIGALWYPLESSINIPECIFIHKIISQYFRTITGKCIIIEIGCAYGMSGMIIANACCKDPTHEFEIISIDPNQRTEWHGVGEYNIKKVISGHHHINYRLNENFSTALIGYPKANIIFIDGSHEYMIVYHDIMTADKIVIPYGIIILDDVLHDGVAQALTLFMQSDLGNKYVKICFDDKDKIMIDNKKSVKSDKKSHKNPKTMSAYMRIS